MRYDPSDFETLLQLPALPQDEFTYLFLFLVATRAVGPDDCVRTFREVLSSARQFAHEEMKLSFIHRAISLVSLSLADERLRRWVHWDATRLARVEPPVLYAAAELPIRGNPAWHGDELVARAQYYASRMRAESLV